MPVHEIILTLGLALFLVGLAGYFLVRQAKAFRNLRADAALTADDRRYVRAQTQRRVVSSLLMIILAGFLVAWVFIAPELPDPDRLGDPAAEKKLTADEKSLMQMVTFFWATFLLVLFALLALASLDLISTARLGLRQQRQLIDERKIVIEEEIARLKQNRRERNGQ